MASDGILWGVVEKSYNKTIILLGRREHEFKKNEEAIQTRLWFFIKWP